MTQEQKIKEFVDKWVGKHGVAGNFHNYRKDCIQDLTNLFNNWISVEDELPNCDSLQYLKQVPTTSSVALSDMERFSPTKKGILDARCTHWQPLPQLPKEQLKEKNNGKL